jgi:hypothetical protein
MNTKNDRLRSYIVTAESDPADMPRLCWPWVAPMGEALMCQIFPIRGAMDGPSVAVTDSAGAAEAFA